MTALRDGGLVLHLRHTETTAGGIDSVSDQDAACPAAVGPGLGQG